MDARDFLIELNSSLNFHFAGQSVIPGTYGGYIYEISFEPDGRLKAHTNVRLFGDLPVEEHIAEAYRKLSCFSSYTLVEDSIDLFADAESLDEDKVFSITVDISSFSGTLNSLGYKTVAAPEPETDPVQQPAAYQNPVISQIETDEEEPHLPRKIGLGILGVKGAYREKNHSNISGSVGVCQIIALDSCGDLSVGVYRSPAHREAH